MSPVLSPLPLASTAGQKEGGSTRPPTPCRELAAELLLHLASTAGQKQLHSTHSLHLKNTREQSSFIGGCRGRRCHTEFRPRELKHGGGEPYTPDLAAEIWGETAYGQDVPYEKTKEKTTPNYSGAAPCPTPACYSSGGDKGEARLSAVDSQELELG
jgi:hypothetical protein